VKLLINPKGLKTHFSVNTKETYEVIADLISLNLLNNFTKQTSTVIASKFHKSYSTFHLFGLFATFNLLGYISEITTAVCEIDATVLFQ